MFDNMETQETDDVKQTKDKIIILLNRSKKFIWMSSGLNSEFYNDPQVKNAMVDALKQVEYVKIIIDGDIKKKRVDLEWLFNLADKFKEKIRIKQSEHISHWLIVDGKHFRLERSHNTGVVGVNNLFVIDVGQPIISDMLMKKYEKWWLEAKPIEP